MFFSVIFNEKHRYVLVFEEKSCFNEGVLHSVEGVSYLTCVPTNCSMFRDKKGCERCMLHLDIGYENKNKDYFHYEGSVTKLKLFLFVCLQYYFPLSTLLSTLYCIIRLLYYCHVLN